MMTLKTMLPENCRPSIITDAGFRPPWFELIRSLDWDFVGRVRNRTFCRRELVPGWFPAKDLYAQATTRPKQLGAYQLCRNTPMAGQLVMIRKKPQGRKDKTVLGDKARRNHYSRKNAARETEPWLLVTSLKPEKGFAKRIVKLYQTRMQIEESFRDLKTGLKMNLGDTRILKRLKVLFVIAVLAQFVLYLLGMAVKMAHLHRRYQANSVKDKAVLSYQFIGLRAFKDRKLNLEKKQWIRAFEQIQRLMREPLYV
jgi:IS4 transposase